MESTRRSIRYQGYDYSMAGYYALTVCAAQKAHLFGSIEDAGINPSELGLIVQEELLRLPGHNLTTQLDEWIIMPNHLHFILILLKNQVVSVSRVVGALKSRCYHTWRERQLGLGLSAPPSCWQRNYYERIIRNADELDAYRKYIRKNPERWQNV